MKMIKILLIAVYCLLFTDYAYAQEARGEKQEVKADSAIIKSDLIKKYETEIARLQNMFDQIFIEIAQKDPIVAERMNVLITSNPKSISVITALQVYQGLINDLLGKEKQAENK